MNYSLQSALSITFNTPAQLSPFESIHEYLRPSQRPTPTVHAPPTLEHLPNSEEYPCSRYPHSYFEFIANAVRPVIVSHADEFLPVMKSVNHIYYGVQAVNDQNGDCNPHTCPVHVPSISQHLALNGNHRSWRLYGVTLCIPKGDPIGFAIAVMKFHRKRCPGQDHGLKIPDI